MIFKKSNMMNNRDINLKEKKKKKNFLLKE